MKCFIIRIILFIHAKIYSTINFLDSTEVRKNIPTNEIGKLAITDNSAIEAEDCDLENRESNSMEASDDDSYQESLEAGSDSEDLMPKISDVLKSLSFSGDVSKEKFQQLLKLYEKSERLRCRTKQKLQQAKKN